MSRSGPEAFGLGAAELRAKVREVLKYLERHPDEVAPFLRALQEAPGVGYDVAAEFSAWQRPEGMPIPHAQHITQPESSLAFPVVPDPFRLIERFEQVIRG